MRISFPFFENWKKWELVAENDENETLSFMKIGAQHLNHINWKSTTFSNNDICISKCDEYFSTLVFIM